MGWLKSASLGIFTFFWLQCRHYMEANDTEILTRQKRNLPLVFPEGGTFKLLLGWGIPIKNPANINLVFAYNIQYQYAVPPNISLFTKYFPYVTVSRRKRSEEDAIRYEEDRYVFYNTMENAMDQFGMNGRQCLLRTICEAAETPVDHNGFMGELFHMLLTPNYGVVPESFPDYVEYGLARKAGEQMYDCRRIYPECPPGHGLFDMISILE